MKILAIKLRAIGDTVIWTSALAALRKAHPNAEIHILTYHANAAVLADQNFYNRAHFLKSKGRFELIRMLWSLRGEKFEWLLAFHATTSLCRWAWLCGAKHMVLHHHSWTYTPKGSEPIPEPGKLENAILRDYQILRAMRTNVTQEPTHIAITQDESQWAVKILNEKIAEAGGDVTRPRYLFLPGAGHHLRRYPKDLWWPEVLKIRDQGIFQPVVLADEELAREWNLEEECLKMRLPLVQGGSLRAFIALISRGQKALANDSGPGHISVALGLPTSFVFGPGCAGDWHCYDPKLHPIYRVADVDCRLSGPRDREIFQYCSVESCNHHKCMREIRLNIPG